MEPEQKTTKKSKSPITGFMKISSHEFLFLLAEASLILYPGSYAVINQAEFDSMPEYALNMIKVETISEEVYLENRAKQGLLGIS
jgi:hypothetical protein